MTTSSIERAVSSMTPRLLLGPGPSPVSPRVLAAASHPTVGHLDPQFLELMDDANERLRRLFRTRNQVTFAVSGTGSAGMEAALVNLIEPNDTVIVGTNGLFGLRLVDVARRVGADVVRVEAEWGMPIDPDRLIDAHRAHPSARLLALVHAETSTGVRQPLEEISAHLRDYETFLVVDAVTSLGGIPVEVDGLGLDVCYSGTQKCLGGLPGLAPITFSPRAVEHIRSRETPVRSWYLDISLITGYLGSERRYHHTAPINLIYSLHEVLREIDEEGLEDRFLRHRTVGERLQGELGDRGFQSFTASDHRLPQLTAVHLPDGRPEAALRQALLEEYHIEVGGGLGPSQGKIWRIGLMGYGAQQESVDRLLEAVDRLLGE